MSIFVLGRHWRQLEPAQRMRLSKAATVTVACGCGAPAGTRCHSVHGKATKTHFWRLVRLRKLRPDLFPTPQPPLAQHARHHPEA